MPTSRGELGLTELTKEVLDARKRDEKREKEKRQGKRERERRAWRANVVETHFDVFSFSRKLREKQAFQAIYAFTGEVLHLLHAETY